MSFLIGIQNRENGFKCLTITVTVKVANQCDSYQLRNNAF